MKVPLDTKEHKMKLQLALDDLSLEQSLELVGKVHDYVDIIEVGSPMIIEYGMVAVRRLREEFPDLEVLADTKIMDAGDYEAELTFKAGAHYCTVLGVTDIATIQGCLSAAGRYGRKVYVDMICVPDMPRRIRELEDAGVRCLGVHTGVDQQAQGRTPLEDLAVMRAHSRCSEIAVAGGISPATVGDFAALDPQIVIVGSGITHADDPVAAARALHDALPQAN